MTGFVNRRLSRRSANRAINWKNDWVTMSSAARFETISAKLPPGSRIAELRAPLRLRRGGVLRSVNIAYETWGTLNARRDNAILLFTGLSPSAHAAPSAQDPTPGWWDYMIGPGRPIDTRECHLICVNSLGSCFGSTGPASINPQTNEPYRLSFPELAIEDIARAARDAVRALGLRRLRAVVGASLGGMSALAYAIEFPDEVENLITISSAARATPFAIAIRSLQRDIIRSDPNWNHGNYDSGRGPIEGMRLARKLGLTSYRSAVEWQQRFGRERIPDADASAQAFGPEFQVESYLDANARQFVGSFDANSYLYLSRAMDWFDVAEHGSSVETGLARVQAKRTLVIGVETDFLFPLWQQQEIAEPLRASGRDVTFSALPSIHGHDSFLLDKERFAPLIADFLNQTKRQ